MNIANHPSTNAFPQQVDVFIPKKIALGGLVGPFDSPLFDKWAYVSPLMTRPKAVMNDCRVITHLTLPYQMSVNTYIRKNMVLAMTHSHCLSSVYSVMTSYRLSARKLICLLLYPGHLRILNPAPWIGHCWPSPGGRVLRQHLQLGPTWVGLGWVGLKQARFTEWAQTGPQMG